MVGNGLVYDLRGIARKDNSVANQMLIYSLLFNDTFFKASIVYVVMYLHDYRYPLI